MSGNEQTQCELCERITETKNNINLVLQHCERMSECGKLRDIREREEENWNAYILLIYAAAEFWCDRVLCY